MELEDIHIFYFIIIWCPANVVELDRCWSTRCCSILYIYSFPYFSFFFIINFRKVRHFLQNDSQHLVLVLVLSRGIISFVIWTSIQNCELFVISGTRCKKNVNISTKLRHDYQSIRRIFEFFIKSSALPHLLLC